MIAAAAVITRPVAREAVADRALASRRAHPLLVDAADQEDLVVHREAEEDREQHHGQERVDRARLPTPSSSPPQPHWKIATTTPSAAPTTAGS